MPSVADEINVIIQYSSSSESFLWGISPTHSLLLSHYIPIIIFSDCKLIALSCNTVSDHKGWIEDIKSIAQVNNFSYPIIEDGSRDLAVKFGNAFSRFFIIFT